MFFECLINSHYYIPVTPANRGGGERVSKLTIVVKRTAALLIAAKCSEQNLSQYILLEVNSLIETHGQFKTHTNDILTFAGASTVSQPVSTLP